MHTLLGSELLPIRLFEVGYVVYDMVHDHVTIRFTMLDRHPLGLLDTLSSQVRPVDVLGLFEELLDVEQSDLSRRCGRHNDDRDTIYPYTIFCLSLLSLPVPLSFFVTYLCLMGPWMVWLAGRME